jgi:germination protein M
MKWQRLNRKFINIIILLIVCSFGVLGFCGCEEKHTVDDSGTKIYYVNQEEKKLVSEKYSSNEEDSMKLMGEYLHKLSDNGNEKENGAAIPTDIEINGYDIIDGIATIDFSEDYSMMEGWREVLCRSAVVLTLTQIKEVEYVAFTVNDTPLRQKDGNLIGTMKASDFVTDLGGGKNTYSSSDFVL